jgi:hypothetical protein
MTAEYCTDERLTVSMPQAELSSCRAPSRVDEAPPRAAELFYEAGLAIGIPLIVAFLITLGTGISVASLP